MYTWHQQLAGRIWGWILLSLSGEIPKLSLFLDSHYGSEPSRVVGLFIYRILGLIYGEPTRCFVLSLKWVCQRFSGILLKNRTKQEAQKNLCVFSLTQMPGLAFWAAKEGSES